MFLIVLLVSNRYTKKEEGQKLFVNNGPTVSKVCVGCKFDYEKQRMVAGKVTDSQEQDSHRWWTPVDGVTPVIVSRIAVLPVYAAYANNPKHGFDENKVFLVPFTDLTVTDELSPAVFDNWEVLFWSILVGFAIYAGSWAIALRGFRHRVLKIP